MISRNDIEKAAAQQAYIDSLNLVKFYQETISMANRDPSIIGMLSWLSEKLGVIFFEKHETWQEFTIVLKIQGFDYGLTYDGKDIKGVTPRHISAIETKQPFCSPFNIVCQIISTQLNFGYVEAKLKEEMGPENHFRTYDRQFLQSIADILALTIRSFLPDLKIKPNK